MSPAEPQSASDYDDRTTAAVKAVLIEVGQLLPYLGSRPIYDYDAGAVERSRPRESTRGRNETAHRVWSLAGWKLRFAVATGRAEHDLAADLNDALVPVSFRNFASATDPVKAGELLRAIDEYAGN